MGNRRNMEIMTKLRQDPLLWDLYSRKEEYTPKYLDKYERFPHYCSGNREILTPWVSKFFLENGYSMEYPDNKSFAVCLTHDIDAIYFDKKFLFLNAVNYLAKGKVLKAIASPFSNNKSSNPLRNFKQIMNLESRFGARSTFFFMTLSPRETDFNYRIGDITTEMGELQDNGFEIGLHGGHTAYNNLEKMCEEKKSLEKVIGREIHGYRNHYLRFKVPDTWEQLKKAGFRYDTTFGYHDCIGFRNGMCHPFKPYNLEKNDFIDILEIPLVVMDDTIFKDYMRLNIDTAWRLLMQVIDTVERYHGVLTVLWHNNTNGKCLSFYEKLLNYCYQKNAWLTNGESIMSEYTKQYDV